MQYLTTVAYRIVFALLRAVLILAGGMLVIFALHSPVSWAVPMAITGIASFIAGVIFTEKV